MDNEYRKFLLTKTRIRVQKDFPYPGFYLLLLLRVFKHYANSKILNEFPKKCSEYRCTSRNKQHYVAHTGTLNQCFLLNSD